MLQYVLAQTRREEKRICKKGFGFFKKTKKNLVARNSSKFDSHINSKILPPKQGVVDLTHTGECTFSI